MTGFSLPLRVRLAAWVVTGPLGHLWAGAADWASLFVRGRPGRGSSSSPSRRSVRNRLRHLATVLLRPALLTGYVAILAFTIGIGTLIEHLPIILEALGGGERASSYAFTVYAVVAMIDMAGAPMGPSKLTLEGRGRVRNGCRRPVGAPLCPCAALPGRAY